MKKAVSIAKCDRERDPAGHLKHLAINEGGDGDEKPVAITQVVKTVHSKAYKAGGPVDSRDGCVLYYAHSPFHP